MGSALMFPQDKARAKTFSKPGERLIKPDAPLCEIARSVPHSRNIE